MKKRLWIPALAGILIFIGKISAADQHNHTKIATVIYPGYSTDTINTSDTLFFDLSQAICSGGYIDIPVYISSDDTVYSLDFSMMYTLTKLSYVTVYENQLNIYTSAYFNPSDSVLRGTAFGLQQMDNDSILLFIRFNLLSGFITAADFNSILVYLNGDPCTFKIINPVTITYNGVTSLAAGDSVCLDANGAAGFTYSWSTGTTDQSICVKTIGSYFVTIMNAGGCSSVSSPVIVSSSLPVELVDFDLRENEEGILVTWTTASEINNDYFTVERSSEGNGWEEIGSVNGSGNSTTHRQYSFMDSNPFTGLNYYRLKQTDYDGSSVYSAIKTESVKGKRNSLKIFPNPVTDHRVNFEITDIRDTEDCTVRILNALGATIYAGLFQPPKASDRSNLFNLN